MAIPDLTKLKRFQWDTGNTDKSFQKHGITPNEAEEVFLDNNVLLIEDYKHSGKEDRFIAIGKTIEEKVLFIVFTLRRNKIRIISVKKLTPKKGSSMVKLKKIPKFKSEKEEREFWQTHNSTEYVDYSTAKRVSFPNLKLTNKPITIRLPVSMIDRLKIRANKMDIPYQSLIKKYIFDALNK